MEEGLGWGPGQRQRAWVFQGGEEASLGRLGAVGGGGLGVFTMRK